MTFNPNVQLDPTQVTDVRGRSMGRGGGLAVGGGGIGLVIAILYVLLGGNPGDLISSSGGSGPDVNGPNSSALAECKTGTQANEREDCQIVGCVNSVQAYWAGVVQGYRPAETILFSGSTSTGCGDATTAVGPFYCPVDTNVYLDLGFFQELHDQLGANAGPFARDYVVAHEYGHHVQDLVGDLQSGGNDTGATGRSVRTELQADCYAGVWGNHATATGFLQALTDGPDQRRARCRGRRRRRPDPGRDEWPGQPGDVDPRLGRATTALVQARVRQRRSGVLRHVQRHEPVARTEPTAGDRRRSDRSRIRAPARIVGCQAASAPVASRGSAIETVRVATSPRRRVSPTADRISAISPTWNAQRNGIASSTAPNRIACCCAGSARPATSIAPARIASQRADRRPPRVGRVAIVAKRPRKTRATMAGEIAVPWAQRSAGGSSTSPFPPNV